MSRPVWFDARGQGARPTAAEVADSLDAAAAQAKGPLQFQPVAIPPGTDFALLHQASLVRARRLLASSHAELDRILAQEVRAIDDLVRTANLLVERLREWYALHAPEATRQLTDPQALARLVATHGDRDAVLAAVAMAQKGSNALPSGPDALPAHPAEDAPPRDDVGSAPPSSSLVTLSAAPTSLGTDLEPGDMAAVQGFAAALSAVHASWSALESRVSQLMLTVAPNVASVVGPVLGARLIALSGGLERLALWPSGTVQLLGAETALFRHIKEGTKPPKHGILFQHPLVHQAAPWSRGAMARALALAVATAAKADAFTKADLKEHLQGRLQDDLARIAKRKMPARRPAFGAGRTGGRGPGGPRGPVAPRAGMRGAGPPRGPPGRAPRGEWPARQAPAAGAPWRGPPRGPGPGGAPSGGPPGGGAWRAPAGSAGPGPRGQGPPPSQGSREAGPRGPWRPAAPGDGARGPWRGPDARGPGAWSGNRDARAGTDGATRGDKPWTRGPGAGRGDASGDAPGRMGGPGRAGGGTGNRAGDRAGPGGGAGAGKPWRRKPQGAFRSDNKPAAPPGRRRKEDDA